MTKAKAAETYKTLRTYESKSKPGEVHTVKKHRETGALSCDCMSWIMNPTCPRCDEKTKTSEKGAYRCVHHGTVPRACKHIRHYMHYEQPVKTGTTVHFKVPAPFGGQTPTQAAVALAAKRTPTEEAVFAAAAECGVLGMIADSDWRRLARKLVRTLPALSIGAPLPAPDDECVRHIVLED